MTNNRVPTPPPGFIPFHWKTRPYERDKSTTVQVCPVCDNFGSVWKGGGLQDPGAQEFLEKVREADGRMNSYAIWCQEYEGVMLKEHWSRYGEGECTNCGVKFWHDFIGYPWHYYYNPETAKVSRTYTPMLPL